MSVIIRPIISEKANIGMETLNQYSFYVQTKANKIQIKKEIEDRYGVTVENVSTMVVAPTVKVKFTKSGLQVGKSNKLKKAIVKLKEGDAIDIYSLS